MIRKVLFAVGLLLWSCGGGRGGRPVPVDPPVVEPPPPLDPPLRGGTNYAFYRVDSDNDCFRECYGVIKNYHDPTARTVIDGQLDAMRANGQERLRLSVHHIRGFVGGTCGPGAEGTLLSSTGGDFDTEVKENISDLLETIRRNALRARRRAVPFAHSGSTRCAAPTARSTRS